MINKNAILRFSNLSRFRSTPHLSTLSRSKQPHYLTEAELHQTLAIPDLSDPKHGVHAINLVVDKVKHLFLNDKGAPLVEVHRKSPISTITDEFDNLYFPQDGMNRLPIYTRYLSENTVLRTHTTSIVPKILRELKTRDFLDYVAICPGICYRRDVIDRKHVGEPHQMDIWRIRKGTPPLKRDELIVQIELILRSLTPSFNYRANEVKHPYTINGLEVEVEVGKGQWMELFECGEAHPKLLEANGLNPLLYSGLAMGFGLDRLVMLIKNIEDIRLLRSQDPRIKMQMSNLLPYNPVSKYSPVKRDFSIAALEAWTEEDLCMEIKGALGKGTLDIEELTIINQVPYADLPFHVRNRLGMLEGDNNIVFRVLFRSNEKNLTGHEINEYANKIFKAVHCRDGGYSYPSPKNKINKLG